MSLVWVKRKEACAHTEAPNDPDRPLYLAGNMHFSSLYNLWLII